METIEVKERTELGKSAARGYRRQGLVPCIFYGEERPVRHLLADANEMATVLRHGEKVVELAFKDEGGRTAFVKEVQFETLTERVLHVDFVEIRIDQEITVSVPLVLRGTAKGVQQGAMVEQVAHEIEVACLPTAIPEEVVVRIDELDLGDIWHAVDLPLQEGLNIASPPDTVIVTCHMPRGLETEEPEEEPSEEVEPVRVEKERTEDEILDQQEQQERKE